MAAMEVTLEADYSTHINLSKHKYHSKMFDLLHHAKNLVTKHGVIMLHSERCCVVFG